MEDRRSGGWWIQVEGDIQEPAVFERPVVNVVDIGGAGFSIEAVGELSAHGENTTTGPRSCLQDRHFVSGLSQFIGRNQTGQAGADDDDLFRRAATNDRITGETGTADGERGNRF